MVTIKDIAKAANVSSGTVSNVLNKKGNVTEEKIRRVEEAVMRLGYEVNESAKILRKKTRNSIAVIVPNFRGRHYIELFETLTKDFAPYDWGVSIYYTNNLYERERDLVRRMISLNVSCIVAFPTYIDEGVIYNKIPETIQLVLVGPRPTGTTRPYLQVSFDYEKIAHNISDYVISKRYKNVDIYIDSVRFSRYFLYIIIQRLSKVGINVRQFGSTDKDDSSPFPGNVRPGRQY